MQRNFLRMMATVMTTATLAMSMATPSHAFTVGGMTRAMPQASIRPGAAISTRRETLPPFAFVSFCERNDNACARKGSETSIDLTREARALMQRVNAEVNSEMVYKGDASSDDVWQVGGVSGDCEDFVLTKRKRLLDAGWPSGALRIATARTASGVGHAVLVVSTTKGDLILDNRTNIVKPWFASDLRWIKIQSPTDPRKWLAI